MSGSGHRVVFGVGPVSELVGRRPESVTYLLVDARRSEKRGDPVAAIVSAAAHSGIATREADAGELDRLAEGGAHQGAIALTGEYAYADLEDLLAIAAERRETPLVVALDGVTDPHNLGAILRSAYLLGAHGVIVPRDRAGRVTPVVTKASAGATEHLAVAQVVNLTRALETLKEAGLWVAGVSAGRGGPLWSFDGLGPTALVLGSEGKGIRPLVAKTCDHHVEIPMSGAAVGSFNVSVAAALTLYEISRQRALRSS